MHVLPYSMTPLQRQPTLESTATPTLATPRPPSQPTGLQSTAPAVTPSLPKIERTTCLVPTQGVTSPSITTNHKHYFYRHIPPPSVTLHSLPVTLHPLPSHSTPFPSHSILFPSHSTLFPSHYYSFIHHPHSHSSPVTLLPRHTPPPSHSTPSHHPRHTPPQSHSSPVTLLPSHRPPPSHSSPVTVHLCHTLPRRTPTLVTHLPIYTPPHSHSTSVIPFSVTPFSVTHHHRHTQALHCSSHFIANTPLRHTHTRHHCYLLSTPLPELPKNSSG
ncbi:hypothetical protein Pcinc_032648 [Petrolisthes cinctipes]|uniref:Uncharacterized protein n=1 Tax=Petrolisthes cinctipes TaxID=88211 RepID=A0AAE1K0E6_PETCI|nr:hypothetical protein Pcinc_032648 [Petrolisthes cinctipes]